MSDMTPPKGAGQHDAAAEFDGALWHKSTYSGSNNGCVERGKLVTGRQAVRDTKDRGLPGLVFGPRSWDSFITAVKGGMSPR